MVFGEPLPKYARTATARLVTGAFQDTGEEWQKQIDHQIAGCRHRKFRLGPVNGPENPCFATAIGRD